MARYRIIKPAHKCQTPIEALDLTEDASRIKLAEAILKETSCCNLGADREEVRKEIWAVFQVLKKWRLYAQGRLKRDFLAVVGEK